MNIICSKSNGRVNLTCKNFVFGTKFMCCVWESFFTIKGNASYLWFLSLVLHSCLFILQTWPSFSRPFCGSGLCCADVPLKAWTQVQCEFRATLNACHFAKVYIAIYTFSDCRRLERCLWWTCVVCFVCVTTCFMCYHRLLTYHVCIMLTPQQCRV